jgi:hypothetical protein
MRLAISGTHCSGKSTLVDGFLLAHPNYVHEPEPYVQLEQLYGESFPEEPSADEFLRQLEYHIERVVKYGSDDFVIFERCALDFVAYLQALIDLKKDTADPGILKSAVELTQGIIGSLDIIAYLPANGSDIYVPEDEDRRLRSAVDRSLERLLMDDEAGMLSSGSPVVLEVFGTTRQRLEMIEASIAAFNAESL